MLTRRDARRSRPRRRAAPLRRRGHRRRTSRAASVPPRPGARRSPRSARPTLRARARPRPRLGAVGRLLAPGRAPRRPHAARRRRCSPRSSCWSSRSAPAPWRPCSARMNAILLRPLPGVADPGVAGRPAAGARATARPASSWPTAAIVHLRDHAARVDGIAAWGRAHVHARRRRRRHVGARQPRHRQLLRRRSACAPALRPLLRRRTRTATPGSASGGRRLARVLAGAPRRRRRGAIGRPLTVNGHPFTLIGVAPPAFRGLYTGMVFDAWAPVMMQPQLRPRTSMHARQLAVDLRPAASRRWTAAAAAAELSTLMDAHRRASAVSPTRRTRYRACESRRSPACPAAAVRRRRSSGLLLARAGAGPGHRRRQRRGDALGPLRRARARPRGPRRAGRRPAAPDPPARHRSARRCSGSARIGGFVVAVVGDERASNGCRCRRRCR